MVTIHVLLSIIRQLRHQVIEGDDDEDAGFEGQYQREHATEDDPALQEPDQERDENHECDREQGLRLKGTLTLFGGQCFLQCGFLYAFFRPALSFLGCIVFPATKKWKTPFYFRGWNQ